MKVLIFGGGGFLGKRLARELLENRGLDLGKIDSLVVFDKIFPQDFFQDPRLELVKADFSDSTAIRKILQSSPDIIFHLAAVVSGEAEKNLDLGIQVNLLATLQLLEICRELGQHPRLIFSSSYTIRTSVNSIRSSLRCSACTASISYSSEPSGPVPRILAAFR